MTGPLLSVVIPAFNKASVLPETLAALRRQTLEPPEYEVIVVDDGSVDGTRDVLRTVVPSTGWRVLRQSNQGGGAARNLGARQARGSVLLFLDADVVGSPGLLAAHAAAHDERDRVLIAGRLRLPERARGTAYGVFGTVFDLGAAPLRLESGHGLTGNLSIKAGHFAELSGFSSGYGRGEDIEFSARARKAQFDILYAPQADAIHDHVLTLRALCEKTRRDHAELVRLLRDHPRLASEFDYLLDKWPVRWRTDGPPLVARKVGRRALALLPARGMMRAVCHALERLGAGSALLELAVWRTLASYQLVGLRDGMARYAWRPGDG